MSDNVPDFQTIMLPLLRISKKGAVSMREAEAEIAELFELSDSARNELLPSGKVTRLNSRCGWARTYLKQAGLVYYPRRGYVEITESGRKVLADDPNKIDLKYLEQFPAYIDFRNRQKDSADKKSSVIERQSGGQTPDEVLRSAHKEVRDALAGELLDKLVESTPAFFESVIVELLLKMGYGYDAASGRVLGMSGDDGVDGVINLDRLGVDQVYVQAKRYALDKPVGSGSLRDFYGALGLKDVSKGIFVTTSSFSSNAKMTAEKLGARIVLIDGRMLARLMIDHEVGCRVTETFSLAVVDESFFE